MSFQQRLVAAVTLVTAVTLGGAFATVSTLVNRDQERQLDQALRAVAEVDAEEITASTSLLISDRPGPAANSVGPLPKFGAIYDERGAVVYATGGFQAPPLSSLATRRGCFDFWSLDVHLRGVAMGLKALPGYTLLLSTPREDLDGDAAFLWRAMAAVWIVAVVWAAAVASWAMRRLVRSHQAIAAAARRVASGDLGARVEIRSRDAEVTQLAADINEMIGQLGALVKSQQRFIAHAAHELRTPLATLLGELSHALRRPRDAAAYRTTIEEALGATRRLKHLSEDLLMLARLGAAPGGPKEAPGHAREAPVPGSADVALRALIDEAGRLVQGEARERDVQLLLSVAEPAPATLALRGSELDLQRMLRNLLENAIRHSPSRGTVEVRARVLPARPREPQRLVELCIADQGPGIPEEERDRVFEPFYRGPSEQASDRHGAGLGLPIAREIARAHGGDVYVQSGPGPGAVVCVQLPAAAAQPPG